MRSARHESIRAVEIDGAENLVYPYDGKGIAKWMKLTPEGIERLQTIIASQKR